MLDERPKPPAEIIRIDLLHREHCKAKYCKCDTLSFAIDTTNREVSCRTCGAIIDPFEVLDRFSQRWDRVNADVERARKQAQELYQYQPRLRAIKELESLQRSGMMPYCPHCEIPIDIVTLPQHSCSRSYGEALIQKANEEREK